MALLINNELAAELLSMQECLAALESVLKEQGRGEAVDRNKSSIHVPTDDSGLWYRYCSMEGASRGFKVAAIRIKSDMISWPEVSGRVRETKYTGRPGLYGGLILLFSTTNGELLAILNDGFIQHLRVAGTYGLGVQVHGSKRCANPRTDRLRRHGEVQCGSLFPGEATTSNQGFQHPTRAIGTDLRWK